MFHDDDALQYSKSQCSTALYMIHFLAQLRPVDARVGSIIMGGPLFCIMLKT